MSFKFINEFHFIDWNAIEEQGGELSDVEKYNKIVRWAGEARGRNPVVFDNLTEWVLDDSEWGDDNLAENEQILMRGVLARFKGQNEKLRVYLKGLEPPSIVNETVYAALDNFNSDLSAPMGCPHFTKMNEAVEKMFSDFTALRDRGVREIIAGNKTGRHGTDSVDVFGYVNHLKNSDAQVQWCLFMPDVVKNQQKGFKLESFEYKKAPALRFIGKECGDDENIARDTMRTLDGMAEYKSVYDYDVLLQHHYGKGVDAERWHGFWGRFMRADAPAPEGFLHFDFIPQRESEDFIPGLPFLSQFAFAVFSGDMEALHKREGFDSEAMYDVTRNIMLGQSVNIPYPDKYWTAEVFLDGCDNWSTAYMFSAEGI